MTVWTLQAPMPQLVLPGGTVIQCEAVSPTTGAPVANVAVTTMAVYGYDANVDLDVLGDTVPLYTPEDVSSEA